MENLKHQQPELTQSAYYRMETRLNESSSAEPLDWWALGSTLCGGLLGLMVDLVWPQAFGLWTLMLALLGLVLGEAYSAALGGRIYR